MAGVTYVSSSGIVVKLLADPGGLGNRETPAVVAVLVFEDLVMAADLPVLTALLSGLGVAAAYRQPGTGPHGDDRGVRARAGHRFG